MGKFRKKPVVIEAWCFDGTWASAQTIISATQSSGLSWVSAADQSFMRIETLEGTMTGDAGDWIIRGIQGELYPCKPDIFAVTYEAVA